MMKALTILVLFVITGFMAYWLGLFEAVGHTDGNGSDTSVRRSSRRSPRAT